MFVWCPGFRIMRSCFIFLIDNLFWIIDAILGVIFDTLSFKDFWATFTRLIKVKLLRFWIFGLSFFCTSFTILLLWSLIVLILRALNGVTTRLNFTWWFPSHGSRCFISVCGCRSLNCFVTLWTIIIWQGTIFRTLQLGFLLFVKFGSLQTAFYAILSLIMMYLNFFGKIYCLINRYYLSERLFLLGIAILSLTRRRISRISFFLLINPLKSFLPIFVLHLSILNYLTHLSIKESISNDHFFLLEVLLESFTFKRKVVKIEW